MKLSPPGLALAIISIITIATQIATLIDPSSFIRDFKVESVEASRFIAYLLILVNFYELIGALQDNWTIYRFGIAARALAVPLFWSFGETWRLLVGLEVGTMTILGAAMVVV
ncbi:hypothetical protein CJF30_00008356 [Rutstroemia sp. NJR-2017a BBW]|nr:hypothetical protein CJF30_00008356 [Rutstroemia sp. NJR-2017a BBW]